MSSDTKIYLNNHAKTEEVFKVILKIAGAEFKKSSGSGQKINKNKPASDTNPWTLESVKNTNNKIDLSSTTYFNFYFEDCIGNIQASSYFFEGYENEYTNNNEKIMNPQSTALWGVIGKRLVDFFGGKVLFNDSSDSDNPENWHVCDNPKYPKKMKEQTSNERYFNFQNTLLNESMMTSVELKEMIKRTRYWRDDEIALFSYLEKYEAAKDLSESLAKKSEEKTITRKLKV